MEKVRSPYKATDDQKLMTEIWDPAVANDPLAFVLFVFPWGKANTPLADRKGPRKWQREKLERIKKHIQENDWRAVNQLVYEIMRDATVSGRGVGKSALVAWIILWFMSTRLGSTTIVTANTEAQLSSRTWPELGRWHTMALNSHWFEKTAMSLRPAEWFEKILKSQLKIDTGYYYAQAQLWSEEKPDSFAGVHNPAGVLVIFDEASGIPDVIWRVTMGFFTETTPNRFWFVFSNGRRNTGPFFECFHKNRADWSRTAIDGRTVEDTDLKAYEAIIRTYGEDSDEARVEVKGGFPKQGDKQFISRALIQDAKEREVQPDEWAPLIMGVDPARYGNDKAVIRFRQGRNARVIPARKFKGIDNMALANECAHMITTYNPDAVCIDVGNGTGVIDRLRQMGYKVYEVGFGTKSPEPQWANFRTYIWSQMRAWLDGGCIDDDSDLSDDLAAPEYKFMEKGDRIRLETKEELKERGFASPDDGDALACTFAVKVARKDLHASKHSGGAQRMAKDIDYPIFS